MRDLKSSEHNSITVFDSLTGTRIKLFYRTPTTKERLRYKSDIVNTLTKTKSVEEGTKIQLTWAKELITGFRQGDFGYDGQTISSNKEDANYYQAWKGIMEETASDILLAFIETVMDRPVMVVKDNEVDESFFSGNSRDLTTSGQTKDEKNT